MGETLRCKQCGGVAEEAREAEALSDRAALASLSGTSGYCGVNTTWIFNARLELVGIRAVRIHRPDAVGCKQWSPA